MVVEANLFSRFFRVIRSYANSIGGRAALSVTAMSCRVMLLLICSSDQQQLPYLCTTVGAAEDPEKILDQAVNEMQSDLIKMRQAAAQVRDAEEGVNAKQGMQQLALRVSPAAKQ